tara:strand:+ start:2167 stop:2379 length:213 start_codon:yes stop_codon:yes gene_type:complete
MDLVLIGIVLNLNKKKDFIFWPTRLWMNKGEPFSNKLIKNIKIKKGKRKIKATVENNKSNKRIIVFEISF